MTITDDEIAELASELVSELKRFNLGPGSFKSAKSKIEAAMVRAANNRRDKRAFYGDVSEWLLRTEPVRWCPQARALLLIRQGLSKRSDLTTLDVIKESIDDNQI